MYYLWNKETDEVEHMDDAEAWAKKVEAYDARRVGDDTVRGLRVSTVFLALDHSGRMFETMVFDTDSGSPNNDLMCRRYEMAAEAREGHAKVVALIGCMSEEDLVKLREGSYDMEKFEFLSGDVNWEDYGGSFVSKKMHNGDWHYWLVIEVYVPDEGRGAQTLEPQNKYWVELRVIAPEAPGTKQMASILDSGYDPNDLKDIDELRLVELLNSHGTFARLWHDSGNDIEALMAAAYKEVELLGVTFGFKMDCAQNAIGSSGWDFVKGDITAGLKMKKRKENKITAEEQALVKSIKVLNTLRNKTARIKAGRA